MKNGREIAERRSWERNKRKKMNKKEKTTQQQKGLPTLSADLNYWNSSKSKGHIRPEPDSN